MKPYSLDLREKILAAYCNKEGTIRQLAPHFKVSARFVGELIVRFRRTGSYAPKPQGGGNPPCITPSQHGTIADLVKQYPDATLQELCHYFEETCHITPSKSSMQRT
jgi:transposase